MSKKDEKLTNFQVPRDPKMAPYDTLQEAPAFDPKNYPDVKVKDVTVEQIAERMMKQREAATGISITKPAEEQQVNTKGVVDDRKKEFWTPPRIGRR